MSFPDSLLNSFNRFPVHSIIEASVPCRVGCGGTWDLPVFALPFERLNPTTVNIALELRTTIRLTSYKKGELLISSKGFQPEEYSSFISPFDSKLGFISAIVSYFGLHGLHIQIESTSPPRSGLGGSGAVAVALIGALNELSAEFGHRRLSKLEIALLAHQIENSLGVSLTGLQDQVAAVYGGVNQWIWEYSNLRKPFHRRVLLSKRRMNKLEKHLLIVYTGMPHDSQQLNRIWVEDFLTGTNRGIWHKIHTLTNDFALAISAEDWNTAATLLSYETELRTKIAPEMIPSYAINLISDAKDLSCGVRFAGAGGGGCIWAIGEARQIRALAMQWQDRLKSIDKGYLLPSTVAYEGLTVNKKLM